MQTPKSRVYVLCDSESRVLRLEGEYSLPANLDGWTKIDEGNGDKYALQARGWQGGRAHCRGN